MIFKLFNALGFQLVWLACVLGAVQGSLWPALALALAFATATLRYGGRAGDDLRATGWLLAIGFTLDSAFAYSGWLRYDAAWPWARLAPAWIWALWLGFAMTVNHSLAFLRGRLALAAFFGLLGGPLAYFVAAGAFDAVSFGAPTPRVLAALGLCWACVLPLYFRLAPGRAPAAIQARTA